MAGGGGVRVGLAGVGLLVGVAGWLVAQAASSETPISKPAVLSTIQRLFTAKWNSRCRDLWHQFEPDNPTLAHVTFHDIQSPG